MIPIRPRVALLLALTAAPLTAPLGAQGKQPVLTSGGKPIAEQSCYDVLHYELSLRVDPEKKRIDGTLAMKGRVLERQREIALDLHGALSVEAVRSDGRDMRFEQRDGRVWIAADDLGEVGAEFSLEVAYGGVPREAKNPPWDGGFTWAATEDGSPWIATSCQGEGADLWWPCKDHPLDEPATMDIAITVPDPLIVASNGHLVGVEPAPGGDSTTQGWSTHRWHVSTPINTYGVALNIAPYKTISSMYTSTCGDEFPITYWVLPENYEKGKELYPQFAKHVRFMEEYFGPYPFRIDKYGVAETPHLGMEHQTIIAYGNQYRGNPWGKQWGFDNLHHHELAHEWWGNLVTVKDWKDFWIHEGFGTYCQSLYTEYLHGEEAYFYEIHHMRDLINRAPTAPRDERSTRQMYFGAGGGPGGDVYFKGAFILHTLRWVMGDDAFFAALRLMAYPDPELEKVKDGGQCRHVDTEEFRAIAEDRHGEDLAWFFEVYLRRAKLPELKAEFSDDGKLHLSWMTPDDLPFPMPLPVSIDGETKRIAMPGGKATLQSDGHEIVIDPKGWVLRTNMPQREKKKR